MNYRHKKTGKEFKLVNNILYQEVGGTAFDTVPLWVFENSEDWEEIKPEPTYQILSFKIETNTGFYKLQPNGNYMQDGYKFEYDLDCMLNVGQSVKTGYITIYSVKRLSDGEVFTLGDRVVSSSYPHDFSITKFEEFRGAMYGDNLNIENYTKYKKPKPLFTTEDGVDLFVNDTVYWVNPKMNKGVHHLKYAKFTPFKELKFFSTNEKANEYIEQNKPRYSKADIHKLYIEELNSNLDMPFYTLHPLNNFYKTLNKL